MVRYSNKNIGIKLSIPLLEEFLFRNKVRISHIEMDHGSRTVVLYLEGAGPETGESCTISEITDCDLPRAILFIKQCLDQD